MAGHDKPRIEYRNPFGVAALCLVTLGIYSYYWFAVTSRTLNQATSVRLPDFIKVVVYPLLGFYGLLLLTSAIDATAPGTNWAITALYVIAGAGLLCWAVYLIYWYTLFARAVHQYTKRSSVLGIFLLVLVLGFIGIGIIQNRFNKAVIKHIS